MSNATAESRRKLVYVNQIYPDDPTGQGSFERSLLKALRNRSVEDGFELTVCSVSGPGRAQPADGGVYLPLDKRRLTSFLALQVRQVATLLRLTAGPTDRTTSIYARYGPGMVGPAVVALVRGIPLVLRSGPVTVGLERQRGGDRFLVRMAVIAAMLFSFRVSTRIIVVTKQTGRWIEGASRGARGKIVVVPNGVALDRFPDPSPPPFREGGGQNLRLFFVGTLVQEQGLATVIRALSLLKREGVTDPTLTVAGDGPMLAPWKALAADLGVADRVSFVGRVDPTELPALITESHLTVLPETRESLEARGTSAIKLYEYLACDRFVLASEWPDLDFLQAEGVGRLLPPDDETAWAEAIREELHRGSRDLGGRARAVVHRCFTYDVVAGRIAAVCFGDAP